MKTPREAFERARRALVNIESDLRLIREHATAVVRGRGEPASHAAQIRKAADAARSTIEDLTTDLAYLSAVIPPTPEELEDEA